MQAIRQLEGGQQLTVFQEVVVKMGYTPTGETTKVQEPVTPPQKTAPRIRVNIQGIQHPTVLGYTDNMNAFDFQGAVALEP